MTTVCDVTPETIAAAQELTRIGALFYSKNWSLATSSNYSALINNDPLVLLMTGSGMNKGELSLKDFTLVDESCRCIGAVDPAAPALKASAEAALHVAIVRETGARSVLHTHSVFATLVSEKYCSERNVKIGGFEMLKALKGINTHEITITVPIYENTQDIAALAASLDAELLRRTHGFLIAGHGLYTWGDSISEARRHVEAFEFLFEIVARKGGYQ